MTSYPAERYYLCNVSHAVRCAFSPREACGNTARMKKYLIPAILALSSGFAAHAQSAVEYRTEVAAHASTGTFAPYYFSANRYGVVANGSGAYARAAAFIRMDSTRRFSYAAGIDLIGDYQSASPVRQYTGGQWTTRHIHPDYFVIQQLYADIKYRAVFLSVGIKERQDDNPITDRRYSSGNLILSGNSRPIPQVEVGFHRFVNIPFTKGWLQIKGNIAYGKFTDDDYLRSHYNYYSSFLTTGVFYHYKSVYFRTNPQQPLVFTIGIEDGVQFGGTKKSYRFGELVSTEQSPVNFKAFVQAFIPSAGDGSSARGDQQYVFGNHVGAIDLALQYNFANGSRLKAYTQWIYEDGSGMGKLNGWDGLWGMAYHRGGKHLVTDAVVEYLDFTNQSGAIPWEPNDRPGTLVSSRVSGGDDYYNNFYFNGWQQGGFGLGTPMSPSVMYNTDGYLRYLHTRLRGVHIALGGYMDECWQYRIMASYRRSWGTPMLPASHDYRQGALLIECSYTSPKLPGWRFGGAVAVDAGNITGDNTGISFSVSKCGTLFSFGKNKAHK